MKIKIERPNMKAAEQIFGRYLTADLPLAEAEVDSRSAAATATRPCGR